MATSRIADSVGRVLGDRYRLTRPLGVGASAHVYVADDISLRRRVAIKLLHPALAADEAFLRRFRAEAQVVAALRHPNILTVFDWGQDDGAPYLVMELLEGGSLRAMLDRGHLLSPAQAAAVGADAARALDYAHKRGLVHRDVKPANLIFDDEGRLTVADFGLARALAEATWTEPAGAVVGTARYAAPEQVRGESLGSRADVYSLALVLIEATTGTVPFAADTTLATLMARLERPVRMPPEMGPLGSVLEAAGTIGPGDRLDALGLARALDRVAAQLPPPGPLPLAGAAAAGEAERDNSPTDYPGRPRLFDGAVEDAGAFGADQERPSSRRPLDNSPTFGPGPSSDRDTGPKVGGMSKSGTWEPDYRLEAERDGSRAARAHQPVPGVLVTGTARRAAAETELPRRRRRWRWVVLVAAVMLLLCGAAAGVLGARGTFTPSHRVPNLVGDSQADAAAVLRPLHLHLAVSARAFDAHAGVGTVISQQPAIGELKEGRTVAVTLSLGPQPVTVPTGLSNLAQSAAESVLQTIGLKAGPVTYVPSMTVPAGDVISSTPDGGTLLPGHAVALLVSNGKPKVRVPSLNAAGMASWAAAQSALAAVHLVAVENPQYSFAVPKGQVMSTAPAAGTTLTVGSQVTVTVSRGPHLAEVPNVVGDTVDQADQRLAGDGFQVSGVTGNPVDSVTATSPGVGTMAVFGSAVQIITG